jgi:hypothetical protein
VRIVRVAAGFLHEEPARTSALPTASAVARLPVPLTFLLAPVVLEVLAAIAPESATRHEIPDLAISCFPEPTIA